MYFYSVLFALHKKCRYISMKSHYGIPGKYRSILSTLLSIQDKVVQMYEFSVRGMFCDMIYFCLSLPVFAMEVKLSTFFLQGNTGGIQQLIFI